MSKKPIHVGFIILAHSRFERVDAVSRFLLKEGSPVTIHFDRRADKNKITALKPLSDRRIISDYACRWGDISLIRATLAALRIHLQDNPDVTHVQLLSESCLPIKPISALKEHLSQYPDYDFINLQKLSEDDWITGGLAYERFAFYHPFNWVSHKTLFDLSVRVQKLLKIQRKIPFGLSLYVGSQWWCLKRSTISYLLTSAVAKRLEQFMRWSWIPDESYFQTLIADYKGNKVKSNLTLSGFDRNGKPYQFYDDHSELLESVPQFFARKIWKGSDRLYAHFLQHDAPYKKDAQAMTLRSFADMKPIQNGMMGQYFDPSSTRARLSVHPFYVFVGFQLLFKNFEDIFKKSGEIEPIFNSFARGWRAHHGTCDGKEKARISPKLMHYNPFHVTSQLLMQDEGKPKALSFDPPDQHGLWSTLLKSREASIIILKDHWKLRSYSTHERKQTRAFNIYQKLCDKKRLARSHAFIHFIEMDDFFNENNQIFEEAMPPSTAHDMIAHFKERDLNLSKKEIKEIFIKPNSEKER